VEERIGMACGACDTFAPIGASWCPGCGQSLFRPGEVAPPYAPEASGSLGDTGETPVAEILVEGDLTRRPEATEPPVAANVATQQEESVEQSRFYTCRECSSPVPPGHKFCGACGTTVPDDALERKVEYFGSMQAPGKARLILIRGTDGADGLSYLLQGTEHVAGRTDAQIPFPNDTWISPRHANFIYRGDKLVVRDEGSLNGVYVRVRGSAPLAPGEHFLCGEQVFRVDLTPKDTSGPEPDQTYFYSSPKRPSAFRVAQVLRGGTDGMLHCARERSVQVGREDNEMNFPDDIYMSGRHARIDQNGDGSFTLHDLGSRNGTYVRIHGERELAHGDYLFVGQQLLRVEQTN
jgi:pSer/pThr/pTyr-binding forkhead associated (FHA) protein/RNA polymerase subunit RPABC4/transcription elongation factor Spt4